MLRIAPYLTMFTLHWVIIAVMLNFKIADLRYVNVTQEVINVIIEKNSIQKSTKDAHTFGVLLFKRKI